ncbi:UDP-glycosyltransferase 43-like [Durio zibethinus]|uniref:Glycosyltransferase n=1 Tax=Durio zibethinus TaxID=66656 RepID=A0A6P6ACG8_DURZI|nr:UDP-glycosyltransferase 43-like [Durio zibethinus]
MNKHHVVFISTPSFGNLLPTIQFARHLTHRDPRLSATLLIITVPQRTIVNSYIQSLSSSVTDVNFIYLPSVQPPSPDQCQSFLGYLSLVLDKHKVHVKHVISELMSSSTRSTLAGLFVDMFTTSMIDVAKQLGIPCYLFFASPASFLGFMLHLPALDTQLATDFVDSDTGLIVPKDSAIELIIPSFEKPLPPNMLPTSVLKRNKDGYSCYLNHARRYKETMAIVINTFLELEPHAIDSLSVSGLPPVYPVGPILDLAGAAQWHLDGAQQDCIMKWLDEQPPSSVVFLCFGSMGSLDGPQLREIAIGLERCGHRFLWSIREPPKGKLDLPGEHSNLAAVLPVGFLDRTAGFGLVCGWVRQVDVLAHRAIRGFVSHCGWNSILESLWYGVPIATWPVYAEQQMNAFELVKELGLGMEIRLDYREGRDLVLAEELERGLRRLMGGEDDEVRTKVREMKSKSRVALMENGSSYKSLGSLIQEICGRIEGLNFEDK